MDAGAHFYKCDFQVHTPRDLNWEGVGATTDDERRQYAREFVAACRLKDLQAVAITDHHDVAFFRHIRDAAAAETDEAGKPLPASQRLVVFPGLELTLSVPCQALLLLDAEFPVDLLPQVVQALSITPAPDCDAKHAKIVRLEHIKTLEDLYAELKKKEFLEGRFIVFPHVGENGQFSIIRKGMATRYKEMPCVGGYVDGSITKVGDGKLDILKGVSKEWGNRAIAVLQTSDCRSRDFARLGSDVTWVKWARPTAEALRQACLARHSRVAHTEPRLPSIRIAHVEVSNSKFLGPVSLDFNPQYNAVIGGRGTGKSTILEYIRWALCDQPPSTPDGEGGELADFQRRRKSLIEGTLLPLDSVVDVSFLLNDVPHTVRRKASGELTLKIGEAAFLACTEQNVRELLPIRAYSQKQLSAVGTRLEELRRFIHAPVEAQLDAVQVTVAGLASELRAAFDRVTRYRALKLDVAAHELERRSLKDQIEKLRSSLRGLSPDDQAIIERQGAYEVEQRAVLTLQRDAKAAEEALTSAASELERLPTKIDDRSTPVNRDLLKRAHTALSQWASESLKTLAARQDAFAEPVAGKALALYFAGLAEWSAHRAAHSQQYEGAKARAVTHTETLSGIQALEARLAEINRAADEKAEQLLRLGDPATEFEAARRNWKATSRERADLLEKQCGSLTATSNSRIRATLRRAADVSPVVEKLKQILKGTGARGEKIEKLAEQIKASASPLEQWHSILNELLELAWIKVDDEAVTTLPHVPNLDNSGFTQKDKLALARQLEPATWLDLLVLDLKDLPVFEYQVRDGDFLPFENASPGQQATALLSILLLQDGPPLLIDQPEDDLNMRIISEIVETLWKAKAHRQVVFASHNANLVVNGDAELVICCDYRTSATESGGQIKLTGAIDVPAINIEIADVMEGGVDAFKLRQQKYGF